MKNLLCITLFFSLFLATKSYGQTVSKNPEAPVFTIVEVMPEYSGGQEGLANFLRRNVVYPKDAMKANVQGKVYVQFVVDYQGNVINVSVVRGVYPSIDAEAIRVVKMMPKGNLAHKEEGLLM